MKQLSGAFTCAAALSCIAPLRVNAALAERGDENESTEYRMICGDDIDNQAWQSS